MGKTNLDWTGAQLHAARDELRIRAELLLGRMLFEYSRLESTLDLCLAWVQAGETYDERARKIQRCSFFDKLELLETDVRSRPVEEQVTDYMDWLARTHAVRAQRNILVHGRLGFNVQKGVVLVVSSRATDTFQVSAEYSLGDIETVVSEIESLSNELTRLRSSHPL